MKEQTCRSEVLGSVDKPEELSKSARLARLALILPCVVAGIITLGMSIALMLGKPVDLLSAAAFMTSIAALGAPAAGASASHRKSDSQVRAKALERGV